MSLSTQYHDVFLMPIYVCAAESKQSMHCINAKSPVLIIHAVLLRLDMP